MRSAPALPAAHPPRGLTLLEVLATLAILAVVAAMALPSMSNFQQRQRLVAAAETLASDLTEARFEAARIGQALHVQSGVGSDAGANWCWAVATTANCGCGTQANVGQPSAPGCLLKQVRAADYPGISLLGALHVRLEPQGGAGSVARTELQSRHGDKLRVEVAALGRSRICVPADAQPMASGRYAMC